MAAALFKTAEHWQTWSTQGSAREIAYTLYTAMETAAKSGQFSATATAGALPQLETYLNNNGFTASHDGTTWTVSWAV